MPCQFCNYEKMREATIYSDKDVYVAISHEPLSYGHILIIPMKHISRLEEMNDTQMIHLFRVTRNLIPKLLKAINAKDYNLFINAGVRANQSVPHLHVHIVPRTMCRDHLDTFFSELSKRKGRPLSRKTMSRMSSLIRQRVHLS